MKTTYSPKEIVYLEGQINYTQFFFRNGQKATSSYTLLKFEKKLDGFLRISRNHLINVEYIELVRRHGKEGSITLKSGESLKVTRRRWPIVRKTLRDFNAGFRT